MGSNPRKTADLVAFTEEILNENLIFFEQCVWGHKLDVLLLSALKLFLSILSNVKTKQKCFYSLHITRSKVYGAQV